MGNTTSCAPYATPGGCIRIIDCKGGVRRYTRSVRAAELMLENPGRFVCDSNRLAVGYRVPGLAADDELERQGLYFLLPMDMLFSVLTEEEMLFILSCKGSSGAMKGGAKKIAKIFPAALTDFCLFPAEAKQVMEPVWLDGDAKLGQTAARWRSWRPALDTIEEVPQC